MAQSVFTRIINDAFRFVAQMFAFNGMYERKVVYVRNRLPH